MNRKIPGKIGLFLALAVLSGSSLEPADLKNLVKELFPVPSISGNEDLLAAKVRALLPPALAVEADGLGTIAVRLGGREGPTLLLAALDGYGHMVSGITPEGYLTLDRPAAPPHARFDAFLLGRAVVVSTARGPVHGVVAQPAMHLLTQERRKALVEDFSLETAFVDIAVRSEKEARAKGVELLDAVTFRPELTELAGGLWSGPSLGLKAVAAVLVDLADAPAGGGTVIAWAAQTKVAARGRGARPALGALRAKAQWGPARAVIVDVIAGADGERAPVPGKGPVLILPKDEPSPIRQALERAAQAAGVSLQFLAAADSPLAVPFADAPAGAATLALPVRFLNTPSEVVDIRDVTALRDLLEKFIGMGAGQ